MTSVTLVVPERRPALLLVRVMFPPRISVVPVYVEFEFWKVSTPAPDLTKASVPAAPLMRLPSQDWAADVKVFSVAVPLAPFSMIPVLEPAFVVS